VERKGGRVETTSTQDKRWLAESLYPHGPIGKYRSHPEIRL